MFGKSKNKKAHGTVESRVAAIRTLSAADEKKRKKKKIRRYRQQILSASELSE